MDDYLQTGGIRGNLEILNSNYPTSANQRLKKEDLFLQGYGRQFNEKLSYSMGLAYGSGLFCGSSYGLVNGIRLGGATPKLYINRVLNSCTTYGPGLANQCAAMTMFYYGFNFLVQSIRGTDDEYNAFPAGALSGGLFKIMTSWKSALRYSLGAGVIFSAVDYTFRHGYI